MKYLLLLTLLLTGCAMPLVKRTPRKVRQSTTKRKVRLPERQLRCVERLIDRDVRPEAAIEVCLKIYGRR